MAQRKKVTSNMQKDFEANAKSGLRVLPTQHFSNGGQPQGVATAAPKARGYFANIENQIAGGAPAPAAPAPVATPVATPVQSDSAAESALRAKYGVGVPKPTMMQKLKAKIGLADGGEIGDDIIKRHGLRAAMRAGQTGRVVGPGGPREDKVHAKLSAGEYVLPAKTVEAMGGAEALDAYVRETNDGREPNPTLRMAGGGLVPYNPVVGQAPGPVLPEPQIPTRIPPTNPNAVIPYNAAVGQAPGPVVRQPPLPRTPQWMSGGPSTANPNVRPDIGSKEMREFMGAETPADLARKSAGSAAPLADDAANATSLASKGLRFVAKAAPAAAAGAGLTGAVQSVAENFTDEGKPKVQNFATNMGMGAEQGDSPAWQHIKETGAQGLRVLQNIGDATGAGYLGRAIARAQGGEPFIDTRGTIFGKPTLDEELGGAEPSLRAPTPAAPATTPAAAPATTPAASAAGASDPYAGVKGYDANTGLITRSNIPGDASATTIDENGNPVRTDGQQQRVAIVGTNNPGSRQTVQTVEGRQATLRAAYAPTQYTNEPSSNPALRRDDIHAGANFNGTPGYQTWGDFINMRSARKQQALNDQREANQNNNATLRRGQDMSYAGDTVKAAALTQKANIDAASEASKAQRDQANKDREFTAAQTKQTAEEGRAQQTARAQASDTQRKDIESRFRMKDGDGKDVPDTAKAASYYSAVAKTLPAMIEYLGKSGKPGAAERARVLSEKGVGALEPGDHDMLTDLFARRDRMAQSAGIGPNQGTYKHSDNLLDYMQVEGEKGVEKRVFGGNRINTPAGSVSVNDLKYKEGPANRLAPDWFKTQNIDGTRGLRTE